MPIDPATVPTLTKQDVAALYDIPRPSAPWVTYRKFRHLSEENAAFMCEFARAAYALAASRVDTAEVERRAAREALTRLMGEMRRGRMMRWAADDVESFTDEEYPAPAPRECVLKLGNGESVKYDGKVRYRGWTWDTVAGFVQRVNEAGYDLTDADIQSLYAFATEGDQ